MEKRTHFYVSRKNVLTWMMALCMIGSAVTRIVFVGMKGTDESLQVWSQIILPIAASLLYAAIAVFCGEERFYRTTIPMWLSAFYFGLCITELFSSIMIRALFWIALLFYSIVYTEIISGRFRSRFTLLLLYFCPLVAVSYLNRKSLMSQGISALLPLLPDLLMILGWIVLLFAIRIHPMNEYHPTWGDRPDGRRIRTLPPMAQVSPYLMVHRNESNNLFSDSVEITHIDRYIRAKRKEGMTNFGIIHVLLAAYCRGIAKYPALNRFLSGQKVYSRGNDIQFCLTVKKEMTVSSPDTVIKVHLSPYDTTEDVYRKMNAEIEKVKNSPLDSSFDNTAHLFTLIPGVFLKFVVWLLKLLDYFGLLPKFLLEVSPFHGSVFYTSMGSLGIPPIYHHLYDFGNLPVFCAFGMKRKATEVMEDGTIVLRKYVDCMFTLDERIADGYYYAAFLKHYKRLLQHPEVLDTPPEEVVKDID